MQKTGFFFSTAPPESGFEKSDITKAEFGQGGSLIHIGNICYNLRLWEKYCSQ